MVDKLNEQKLAFCAQDGVYGLQATLFKEAIATQLVQPTFIYDYPIEISPLSRRNDLEQELAERFALFVGGREIAYGSSESNDPEEQAKYFQGRAQQNEVDRHGNPFSETDYIQAIEHGLPPTVGGGIDIDRLVMLLTNSSSVRDVILFPQTRSE